MTNPKVSVIMTARDAEQFIAEAILSIVGQTFPDFELIIVDDASTDGTYKIVTDMIKKGKASPESDWHYSPFGYIFDRKTPVGRPAALNFAVSKAKGKYLAIMDADDLSDPERLEKEVAFLDAHPDVAATGSFYWMIDAHGTRLQKITMPCEDADIREALKTKNQFGHSSVMMRADVFREIGGYNEGRTYAMDYELLVRIAAAHRVANIPEFLMCWRNHRSQISTMHRAEQAGHIAKVRTIAIDLLTEKGTDESNDHNPDVEQGGPIEAVPGSDQEDDAEG